MGILSLGFDNLEASNFDKFILLVLELVYVRRQNLDEVKVIVGKTDDPAVLDVEAFIAQFHREGERSRTESYAFSKGFAGASVVHHVPGLSSLRHALAKNHGKVKGIKGGYLYDPRMFPSISRNLPLLREEAPELILKLLRAIADLLEVEDAEKRLIALGTDAEWDPVIRRLAQAEIGVYQDACKAALDLEEGKYPHGELFDLHRADAGQLGVLLRTQNTNLMKHLWRAFSDLGLKVAVAVVCNPETGRIAILTAKHLQVDIRSMAKALEEGFPGARFDVNLDGGRVIWDPRLSEKPGPTPASAQAIVARHAAFLRPSAPWHRPDAMKLTLEERLKASQPQVTRRRS